MFKLKLDFQHHRIWFKAGSTVSFVTFTELMIVICFVLGFSVVIRQYHQEATHVQGLRDITDNLGQKLEAERQDREQREQQMQEMFKKMHLTPTAIESVPNSDRLVCPKNIRIDNIVDRIVCDEGVVLRPYRTNGDPHNPLVIGIGHNISANGISESAARFILIEDIKVVQNYLRTQGWYDTMDRVHQAAFDNMGFAMGVGSLTKHTELIQAAADHDWPKAATVLAGLPWCADVGPRCTRLQQQLRTGEWP